MKLLHHLLWAVMFPGLLLAENIAASKPPYIVLVGDSTVTDFEGWGLGFRQFVTEGATITNAAQNGRSSKSYRDEGLWAKALALKGDYYLIQFGHNDEPGKGLARETDAATTYAQNMARYVDDVRAIGAIPILVTSLVRRNFDPANPGKIKSSLLPYVEVVKQLAAEKNVPLIDLHARSLAWCEQLGPEQAAKFNRVKPDGSFDHTHLDAVGSAVFAQWVVEELRRAVPALDSVLLHEPRAAKLTDLEYGQVAGEKLLLDVSLPVGDGPFPIAILVHGGGWSRGDKNGLDEPTQGADITAWFAPLTVAKFTWFSLNYRMAPKNRWPACFDDVQTAIRWVKANAGKFKGDTSRIALLGHSSGGQLVCLAATLADDSTRVQAVVGFAPVTDFEFELPARGGLSPSLQALHDKPREVTPETLAILREIAPINHVKPGLPPFLLLHGDADKTVPYQTSLNFQAKLKANGVSCDLITLPGAPHGLLTWEKFLPDYQVQLVAWLQRTLDSTTPGLTHDVGSPLLR